MRAPGLPTSGLVFLATCVLACSSRKLDARDSGTIIAPDAGGIGGAGGAATADAGEDLGPLLPLGRRCALPPECRSGFCAQGVCCETACADPCWSCNQEVTAGACLVRPPGVACAAATCDGDAVVGQKICDGHGTCTAAAPTICAPYACDPATAACRQSCAGDGDCVRGSFCEPAGRCHVNDGRACTQNTQCASGFCADGFCCNTACNGDCMSCDVSGHEGTCSPRPDLCPGADAGPG